MKEELAAGGGGGAGSGGGWLHQYTHVDLSGGLGSDTSFEQSHATSKTFK